MILHPGVLALLVSSLLIALMTLYAAAWGGVILLRWDIESGSELQVTLERRTYLVSTIVAYFLGFQLVSLFLFIQTADSICHLFVGAMCAVGTLTANPYGYPTLTLKIATSLMAGPWLILNRADNMGYDYPMIRQKYLLLLAAAPLVLVETLLQWTFFLRLEPDIITSCCGALFSQKSRGIASEIASLPARGTMIAFYGLCAAVLMTGLWYLWRGRGMAAFAFLSAATLPMSLVAMVSFVSLYFYEMPSHHCPFCILQQEYHHAGYPLYILLLASVITGTGAGVLQPFRSRESVASLLPPLQKKLVTVSILSLMLFVLIITWQILSTSFTLRV